MEPPLRTRLRGPIQGSLKVSRLVWGGLSPSGTHQRLPPTCPQTKYGAFPPPWFCCHGITSTTHRSDCRSALTHFTVTRLIGLDAPSPPAGWHPTGLTAGAETGLSCSHDGCANVPRPLRRWVLGGSSLQVLHPVHGLRLQPRDSAPSWSPHGGEITTRQVSLHVADRWLAPSLLEGSTPRFDAQVSPNAGGLLQR